MNNFYIRCILWVIVLAGVPTLPRIVEAQEPSGEQGAEAVVSGKLVSNVFAATPVAVGQEVSLKQGVISIEVEHKSGASRDHARTRGFRVLFGNLSADQHGKGKLATLNANDGSGIYQDVEWQVLRGYAMARGWRPRIRGTTATAAAEGTEFICQNEQVVASDGTVTEITRIYLISGSVVKVIATDDSNNHKSLTTVDQFIEARKVGAASITLTEPAPIPADPNDPLRSFVNEVKAISLATGL